jgi:sugar phosphate isomerase/epimerase
MPKRLSFQLYSARKFPPLKDTLAMLAKIGYREVEGFGGVYDKPAALRKLLDKNGLTMPTGHFGIDMLEGERPRVLEIAKTLGVRQIYAPYLVPEQRPKNAAGYKKLGKRLAAIGEWMRGEGYGFGWHNHDFEFVKLPTGEIPHDIIFETAPMLDWECDVAWVARSGKNPIPWIKTYAGRITSVHVKDIAAKGKNLDEDGWADLGDGTLDWPGVFKALKTSRAMYYVLEHDNPNDIERYCTRSFNYVSKI